MAYEKPKQKHTPLRRTTYDEKTSNEKKGYNDMERKSVLGRGLRSLIPEKKEELGQKVVDLHLSLIVPNENAEVLWDIFCTEEMLKEFPR